MNRRAGSLRLRLLFGASLAVALALALAWGAMTLIFARHLEQQVAADLQRQGETLVAGLSLTPTGPALDGEPTDPRFAAPAGGLYWQVTSGRRQLRSRSLWDAGLTPTAAPADRWVHARAAGPFGQRLLQVARIVRPDPRGRPAMIQLGFDLARLAPARAAFGRDLALFLLLLWIVLSAAAWAQVSLGLRPLAMVRRELDRLRDDPGARLAGRYPREVAPLAEAVDALAAARERDLHHARRRAADLAHGLKTPLAALSAQSRRARATGAVEAADGLDQAIAAVTAAVEAELARVRVGLVEGGRCDAAALVERLVGVIEHTPAGERLAISVDIPAALLLPLAADDAAELVGPLLDNAARHARRQLRVAAVHSDAATELTVEDDGPGLDAARYEQAVLRGARLDAAGPGQGLGLAIARELAEASGGGLRLTASRLGGLAVTVSWPTV